MHHYFENILLPDRAIKRHEADKTANKTQTPANLITANNFVFT